MNELLVLNNVTKRYGNITALNSITLSLEKGKIIGLLGPNGSGKTTLIKLINGLLVPDSGEIKIDGDNPGTVTKTKVAYLPDNTFLGGNLSVEQTVNLFKDFFADFREDAAYSMLEKLNINKKARLKTLSKGNREKVSLILIMSRNAKLYVLDEPIAAVDPATRDYIISTILNNYNKEACVLISTHIISDIESILDEVIFIKEGNIELHKSVDEIRDENGMSVDELFRVVFKW